MEKFVIGALLGGMAGALIVSNNAKMRQLVKKGEEELKEKMNGMIDEKLSAAIEKLNKKEGKEKADGAGEEGNGEKEADSETKGIKREKDKKRALK